MKTKTLVAVGVGLLIAAFMSILFRGPIPQTGESQPPPISSRQVDHGKRLSSEQELRIGHDQLLHARDGQQRRLALQQLFSENPAERLKAAQVIASYNDEDAFEALAQCVARTEITGELEDLVLADQLGEILSGMKGEHLVAIATELAYSQSKILAEAATNVAVASSDDNAHQSFVVDAASPGGTELEGFINELLQIDQ